MNCKKCNSDRITSIYAKCSDLFNLEYKSSSYEGYVLDNIGIGGGDDVSFKYCLECGQIQNSFPVNDPVLNYCFCGEPSVITLNGENFCQSCYDDLTDEDKEPDVTEEDLDFINKKLDVEEFDENDNFWD
jgi:hypothetical protein